MYGNLDEFAAQWEHNDEDLIQIDPTSPMPIFTTGDSLRPKQSILDLGIDEAIIDDQSSDSGNVCCEECDKQGPDVFVCNVCNFFICDGCWNKQLPHKKKRLGPGGIPHEKTPPDVAKKVGRALVPPTDQKIREGLYEADELTAWFGKQSVKNSPWSGYDQGRRLRDFSLTFQRN
jgi:hypothetical protein